MQCSDRRRQMSNCGKTLGYRAAAPVLVSQEVRRGAQGASCVAPGKLGLDACGKGERVIALESW